MSRQYFLLLLAVAMLLVSAKPSLAHFQPKQTDLIEVSDLSQELKDANYRYPSILQLGPDNYIAVGGAEDAPGGPTASDRVIFFSQANGIDKQTKLPRGLTDAEVFLINKTIYVFGGDGHLTDGRPYSFGNVYRYIESTNSFVTDTVSDAIPSAFVSYFQQDKHVRRLILPSHGFRFMPDTNGRVETYHPGLGWTQKEVPVKRIEEIYQKLLYRDADLAGLNYWSYKYSEGMPLAAIEQAFLQSDEYQSSLDNEQIAQLYRDILKREPDIEGQRYWTLRHKRGMDLEEIKQKFLSSEEFRGR